MNALCRNGHPPRLAAWSTPDGPRCDGCMGYSLEASAFRAEIEFTDFNDCALMSIRDIAAWQEDCSTMRIGETHMVTNLLDHRTAENLPVFLGFLAAVGRVSLWEMTR